MQQVLKIARGLSSPAILIAAVWCATLIGVAVGPIDYPGQPSVPVLLLVAVGVSLFVLAHQGGAWCFAIWLRQRPDLPTPPLRMLNIVVAATSLLGVAGIALMALDRVILSGAGNGGYADLLRCAPDLVDFIEIKRTPLLYLGYLTFSFGFASLVLFLLKGEEIRGWPAILAQLSIFSPVGYALLYSGRMPILFVIVLIIAAVLVRVGQGRRPLPLWASPADQDGRRFPAVCDLLQRDVGKPASLLRSDERLDPGIAGPNEENGTSRAPRCFSQEQAEPRQPPPNIQHP